MPNDKTMVFEAAVPILSVTRIEDALEYYEQVLGFRIEWKWGDPPHLASVCRDHVEVNLSQSSEANARISKVYFQMSGVDAFYRRLGEAGAKMSVPLGDRAYGMRDFRLVDPSGNELSFGEAIDR